MDIYVGEVCLSWRRLGCFRWICMRSSRVVSLYAVQIGSAKFNILGLVGSKLLLGQVAQQGRISSDQTRSSLCMPGSLCSEVKRKKCKYPSRDEDTASVGCKERSCLTRLLGGLLTRRVLSESNCAMIEHSYIPATLRNRTGEERNEVM